MAQDRIVLGGYRTKPEPQPIVVEVVTSPHIGSIFDDQNIDGIAERGYNQEGQNRIQTANDGTSNGIRSIDNIPDGENYVTYIPDVNHMKIRNINSNNETSQLTRNEDGSYLLGDGTTLVDNFSEGQQYAPYQDPEDVNLVQASENNTVTGDKISLGAQVGSTNETSTGDVNGTGTYSTETFFNGTDGKIVGIGVTTEDNNSKESAKAEIDKIANEFIKKESEDSQSDYEKAVALCGDNEDAKKALDAFVDQIYDKDETTGKLTPKDNYDNVDSKVIRDAAQAINNQLRGKENVNEEDLNGLLKYMVGTDAAVRDLQEENNKQPLNVTALPTDAAQPAEGTVDSAQPEGELPTTDAPVDTTAPVETVQPANTSQDNSNSQANIEDNINAAPNNGATDRAASNNENINIEINTKDAAEGDEPANYAEGQLVPTAQLFVDQGIKNANDLDAAKKLLKDETVQSHQDLCEQLKQAINYYTQVAGLRGDAYKNDNLGYLDTSFSNLLSNMTNIDGDSFKLNTPAKTKGEKSTSNEYTVSPEFKTFAYQFLSKVATLDKNQKLDEIAKLTNDGWTDQKGEKHPLTPIEAAYILKLVDQHSNNDLSKNFGRPWANNASQKTQEALRDKILL